MKAVIFTKHLFYGFFSKKYEGILTDADAAMYIHNDLRSQQLFVPTGDPQI